MEGTSLQLRIPQFLASESTLPPLLRKASSYLPVKTRKMLYLSLVLPYLDYCSTVWHSSCSQALSNSVEQVQNYAMRVILHQPHGHPVLLLDNSSAGPLFGNNGTGACCVRCTNVYSRLPPPHTLQANLQRIQHFTHQHVELTSSIFLFPAPTNLRCHSNSRGPCITISFQ